MIKLLTFIACLTGPVTICAQWTGPVWGCVLSAACQQADRDGDGDVDTVDFAAFQNARADGSEQATMRVTTGTEERPWYDKSQLFFGTMSEMLDQQDLFIARPAGQRDCQFLDGAEYDRRLRVVVPCVTVRSVEVQRAHEPPEPTEGG